MKFGRYEILEEIGKGSMGIVYRAYDPSFDRIIALKVLRHDRVTSQEYVQRFLQEAKAIGRLSDPGDSAIVTAHDIGEDNGTVYLAMEFLEGTSLNKIIDGNKLSLKEIVNISIQVAEALNYAHKKGIIHRDIKPANIILTPKGQIKITDFGIARIEDPEATILTKTGDMIGTPSYMAPEQISNSSVDCRSDLYSLGVILYELITGRRPFKGDSLAGTFRAISQDTPIELVKIDPSVSPSLSALVMKSLNKLPANRFQTGIEMAEALRCLPVEEPGEADPPTVLKKLSPIMMGKWPLFVFVSILATVAVILLFFYLQPSVKIESKPEGAEIYVDEILKGETPLLLKLKPGAHYLRIVKELYQPWAKEIILKRGRNEPLRADLMKLQSIPTIMQAPLKMDTKPSGAQVYIDDLLKGETPLKFSLPVGIHQVRITLQDHHDWKAPLQIDEEGEIPLFITLLPKEEE